MRGRTLGDPGVVVLPGVVVARVVVAGVVVAGVVVARVVVAGVVARRVDVAVVAGVTTQRHVRGRRRGTRVERTTAARARGRRWRDLAVDLREDRGLGRVVVGQRRGRLVRPRSRGRRTGSRTGCSGSSSRAGRSRRRGPAAAAAAGRRSASRSCRWPSAPGAPRVRRRWKAAAPSRISSARSAIFLAEWLNAVLAALALSPLNRWSVPIWPERVSSWLASRRSRLSPVFHCCPALSREPSFALAT